MKCDVPAPNPWITQWLRGTECRGIVSTEARRAQGLYRAVVAKRTGLLAASATVETRFGVRGDRWIGELRVTAPYALPHEFGVGEHESSTHRGRPQAAAHDLAAVLRLMGSS